MSNTQITPVDIAVSGLRAQAMRMQVIANNIANSQTTKTADGTPFRRQMMTFITSDENISGVQIGEAVPDMSTDFRRVLQPGHPHADQNGYVSMPNVTVPVEMMEMITASRAYQASAAVLKRFQDITDTTLELLR